MAKIIYDIRGESVVIDTHSDSEEGSGSVIFDSNVEVLKLNLDGNIATTEKTALEIEELYKAGKVIYAVSNIGAYVQIAFGLFLTPEQTNDGYVLYGYTKGDHSNVENIVFTAQNANDVMSIDISNLM